ATATGRRAGAIPRLRRAAGVPTGRRSSPASRPAFRRLRSVHWFGTDYRFTEAQAAIVAALWQAWEDGTPDLGDRLLLQRARVNADRLPDVFKEKGKYHPAWGTMIQSKVGSKSSARLCLPERAAPRAGHETLDSVGAARNSSLAEVAAP